MLVVLEELLRRRTIPAPGEPGDQTGGDVPFEERKHVGAWMVPSYDPVLNLVYIGTSVTSPSPKFMLGGADLAHLYHNSTLAVGADTGDIVWYYQHLNDHWDLDHPFEQLFVDTAVAPLRCSPPRDTLPQSSDLLCVPLLLRWFGLRRSTCNSTRTVRVDTRCNQRRSKRSRVITLAHAVTKSRTKSSCASSAA